MKDYTIGISSGDSIQGTAEDDAIEELQNAVLSGSEWFTLIDTEGEVSVLISSVDFIIANPHYEKRFTHGFRGEEGK